MIPLKLEIHNFLAYREPDVLDLTGLHLACLAGANGAGKSSLLDAITWSLWGKARARRDDDLIYGDEAEMEVRLTFRLEGNIYRVTRQRSRKGRGSSELAIEVQDGETWRLISQETIRSTQALINNILRLDYDTFINSAFLMQGRADEFTQKTPGERKKILGEILGLNVWADYEERAKEVLRRIDVRQQQIEAELQRIDEELGREGAYKDELIAAQEALRAIDEEVAELDRAARELEEARGQHKSLTRQQGELEERLGSSTRYLAELQADLETAAARHADYERLVGEREEIEAGYNALQAARQLEHDQRERLLAQQDLSARYSALEAQINAERTRLEAERSALLREKAALEQAIAQDHGVRTEMADELEKAAAMRARQTEVDAWRAELEPLKEARARLEADNRSLKKEMEALSAQQSQIQDSTEPVCPLCQQDLTSDHRADLLARLASDGLGKGDQYRANRDEIDRLAAEIAEYGRVISRAEAELRNLPPLETHIARLEARAERLEENRARLEQVEAQIAELDDTLASESYASEARLELAEVGGELAALGYDEHGYRQASEDVEAYQVYERRMVQLEDALENLPAMKNHLNRLDEQIGSYQASIEQDRGRIDALGRELVTLDETIEQLAGSDLALSRKRDEQARRHTQVGAAQQKLHALEQSRVRRKTLIEQRDELAVETGIYEQLREAFGKNGVPAMMIEAAIPEIEDEANQILSDMTDGHMHLRFDTQREKVTGGVKETLDILIADNLGTRDYETFSGGEAFRVDFAIRLALSRLLARRAGAQLRTLIIDEGFGTQDARGRERLVQAINTIRDDFDLILVITHIDELKDAFPARIEVTKTPQGSIAEIL